MNANEATLVWVDEYSRMAEAYDRNVTPRFEPIAQEVVRLADPKPNELFLDVGTGTGLLACLIAPRVLPQGVVAIDLADGAISVASYRAGNAGIRNIRFEMLDSRNIVYHGKLFDAAASNLGIPALGYDRVFQEVHRVLKPSGRFVFSEWPTDPSPSFAALRALLEKHGTRTPSKDLAHVREDGMRRRRHSRSGSGIRQNWLRSAHRTDGMSGSYARSRPRAARLSTRTSQLASSR